jgi:glycine/D-amino acid oxidase-like deaminating enzyme
LPIIDKLPEANNIFIATGHYKIGFGYLPATSELMSYLLDNKTHNLGAELYISESRQLMSV